MVTITIRLVGEEKDSLFHLCELDPQIHVDDLKKEVKSVTNIPPNFQQIEFRSEELPDSLHPLESINDFEELVVKHVHLDHWKAYVYCAEEFKNARGNGTRKMLAQHAQGSYDMLRRCSFFRAYANFHIAVLKYHQPISEYLDDKYILWIQNATKYFFALSMFKGQNPVVEFEETNSGTRSAVICKITVNSITNKYRVKTNHNARGSSQASCWDLDLIELYCYKLLESIGVGSKIAFIPNFFAPKSNVYIGSEWLADFQSFNSIKQVNTTEVSHAVVQIYFLAVFLSLGDMHDDNFGINANSDPIILDFMMSNYRNPVNTFLNRDDNLSIRTRDILFNCDTTTRLQIAKDVIRKWNLMDKLGEVLELMNQEMKDFGLMKFDLDKKTRDLEEFVEKVRTNIWDLFRD
ncbi:unnamed protein product [Auanema sp. JU1783]|nr:unnamed protein product [Auanema sp. JU1783]